MHRTTTSRLYQRPWRTDDADAAFEMYRKRNVMSWIPGGAWDRGQTEKFVGRMIEAHERGDYCIYPVLLEGSDRIVGHCGLNNLERGPEIEIAYLFDDQYWGRGFAPEIAAAVLQRAFDIMGLERVAAVAFPENVRSIAVMRKIGMHPVGIAHHFNTRVVKFEAHRDDAAAAPRAM